MKILHLEDNPADAEITQAVFLDEWPDCEVTVVGNRQDFLRELPRGHDLILSDFNLINFTGLEALQLAREKSPAVPFVFFSGTIGEERALDALRSGATDYVIKDRPKRLIPAIQRALNDAKIAREREAAKEQMLRVQRLENIGMLAAGIAHDFNNVLAPILMGIPLLRMRHPGPNDAKILANMESSAGRGAGLVKQILGFAHGVAGEAQLVQPKHLLRELVDVITQTFPRTLKVEDEIPANLWPIKVNPTQFHQVLLNLCVNARDAMPNGGALTLRAANCTLDEVGAAAIEGAKPGPYLAIEVADTGTGMPPEVLGRIWEPFFTTKAPGRGTGLGLSTVRSIVGDHHGSIVVQTQPGRGTTFQIFLPAAPEEAANASAAGPLAIPRGQGELILVADDSVQVREVTCATLVEHGYRVVAAANGTEAVALFAPRSLEVRMVVTDLDMPELDGTALVKVARTMNPAIRVLLVSGSAEVNDARRQPPPGGKFLSKPFTAEALLSTVHTLLQEAPTT
ncbi:MAG TPA: response regulator [Lacunisphaera sp.]|nr:response regulator [Lacunisphaera sp.]